MPARAVCRIGRALAAVLILGLFTFNSLDVRAQGGDSPANSTGSTIHVVQRGENLFRIAQRYGTTVEAIAQANGIRDVTALAVGQRLLIPNVAPSAPGIPTDYTVQPGDSLFDLSMRYGMPIAAIARQNNIVNPDGLYIGQNLALQDGAGTQPQVKTGWVYRVQQDDNLYRVSARYNVSIDVLRKANRLKRDSVLYPGQPLVIPGPDDGPTLIDLPAPFTQVALLPTPPEQGRTVLFHLNTALPSKLTGQFMGKPLNIYSNDARQGHALVFGIDAFAVPGIYPLVLTATADSGQQATFTRLVQVLDGGYTSETITLPPDQMDLLDPKVTQPELDKILSLVSKFTPQRYFDGPMGLPCPAPVTSQFGTRRSYNGGPYNLWHTGTDFAAAPGSAIYAPAAGVVVMAATLHVRGNATIIDHGWGVYTGYWHQSEIKVKVGDVVKPGQVIGLVGSTGRATGPHLHWEMFIGGVQVDPLQWTRQSFP